MMPNIVHPLSVLRSRNPVERESTFRENREALYRCEIGGEPHLCCGGTALNGACVPVCLWHCQQGNVISLLSAFWLRFDGFPGLPICVNSHTNC